ncbi:Hint domain-containing protein [Octadecabacter sp. CECT 8868]|uniref:Hint domain-containing protein n=1 Tax=Octadecabacter algicola TaxID=2909342 RepID=UPI001F2A3C52|nr:Hint domain-containing protein [Octadecabacter algicola]MCF2904385.1 Hint domain-containing protein [Octadecabacter algicola]
MAIGEAGSITTNSPTENAPIMVTFDQALTDPVIVMTGTNNGGNAYTFRITDIQTDANGDATGFTFIVEEWEYLDGPHTAVETFNFLAIEEGVHTLPDGRVIEAGITSATSGNSTVDLQGTYTDAPVVMTSVMSENDTTTVDSDAWNITNSDFTVSLQEEEAEADDHGAETVGYIAVEGGIGAIVQSGVDESTDTVGLGGTFSTPISVADTQTMNGGDPGAIMIDGGDGSTNIGLFFQEEQSANTEVNHINEDVGVITFDDGVILCFAENTLIDTPFGQRSITDLEQGDLILTADAGPQPIQIIADTMLHNPAIDHRPITIRAGSISDGVPAVDLTVSPQHRILVNSWKAQMLFGEEEVLVPAKALVNDSTILRANTAQDVRYIHLGLKAHHLITSNGLVTETLHAGDVSKSGISAQARREIFDVFPDLKTAPQAWGPPARPSLSVKEGRLLVA